MIVEFPVGDEAEGIVIYPICQVDGCGERVVGVTEEPRPDEPVHAEDLYRIMPPDEMRWDIVGQPCGHVQRNPSKLVWVVREGEPDCGC